MNRFSIQDYPSDQTKGRSCSSCGDGWFWQVTVSDEDYDDGDGDGDGDDGGDGDCVSQNEMSQNLFVLQTKLYQACHIHR